MTNATTFFLFPLAIFAVSAVIVGIYGYFLFSKKKVYDKYLKMPGPLTGKDAVAMIMNRAGYEATFYIYKQQKNNQPKPDPFYGNAYLPDKNAFIMTREILDGRSLLSTCIGCQLATTALRYIDGDICKDRSIDLNGEFALKYVFDQEEIKQLKEKYSLYNAAQS